MLGRSSRSTRLPPFIIVGQERSGTTLMQTLLSSHPDVHCRGELLDPWQIDDDGQKTKDKDAIFARETDIDGFLREKLSGRDLRRSIPKLLGFKLLTHHNPDAVLRVIPQNPEWRILHVRRQNKLAQFSSRQQVHKSGRWTSQDEGHEAPLIEVAPKWAAAQCNSLRLEDELLHIYLKKIPNPVHTVHYTELHQLEIHRSILTFLGVNPDVRLQSSLKKQGQAQILSRFGNSDEIAEHFIGLGLESWLYDG